MADVMAPNKARFTLEELDLVLRNESSRRVPNFQMAGVVTDSRRVESGNIFVALKGEKFDGHDYLPAIARIPKIAAIVSRSEPTSDWNAVPCCEVDDTLIALGDLARHYRQRFQVTVVAVTGSYGKTSTRALIGAALSAGGETLASQANFNNEIGLPMTLFQLETKHQFAVLEMGMRGLKQIDYLAKIAQPTVGVITNIGPQHIELLGDLENIARAKTELIENLPADGLAVLPADSPFLPMLEGKAPCRFVTFGLEEEADYRVTEVETRANGNVSFVVSVRDSGEHKASGTDVLFQASVVPQSRLEKDVSPAPRKFAIELPIPGAHNACNAAAAFAVAHQLGVAPKEIVAALKSAELPGARMRVLKASNGVTIIDDCYNAGPDSMRAALETLRDFPGSGRRVAVLGAMRELGEFSDDEHRKIGALAGEICDVIIGVGPETEPMMETLSESGHQLFGWSPNADGAIPVVLSRLQIGDVVLVKGSRSVVLEVVVEVLNKNE